MENPTGRAYCCPGRNMMAGLHWPHFDPSEPRYHMCKGTIHVIDAAKWVNLGQAAVALVELLMIATLYLIHWNNPRLTNAFDGKVLIIGICLFALNAFFACVLRSGIRHEICGMIVADLGWMAVSAAIRAISIVLLIAESVYSSKDAMWLSAGVVAALASFVIQCLSCFVLAQCAHYLKDVQRNRSRMEAFAAARILMTQYCRPAVQVHRPRPPPPYEIATLTVPPAYQRSAAEAAQTGVIVETAIDATFSTTAEAPNLKND